MLQFKWFQLENSAKCMLVSLLLLRIIKLLLWGEGLLVSLWHSATLKNGDQTCLDPDSARVKKLMKEWEKKVGEGRNTNCFLLEINSESQQTLGTPSKDPFSILLNSIK